MSAMRYLFCLIALSCGWSAAAVAQPLDLSTVLQETPAYDWPDSVDVFLMDGAHRFVERKIAEAAREREQYWHPVHTSPSTYEASVRENRQHLRTMLGVINRDSRDHDFNIGLPPEPLPGGVETFGIGDPPGLVADDGNVRITQVRWHVLNGVTGEGLLLEPETGARANVVVLPDVAGSPESMAGVLSDGEQGTPMARILANAGCRVLVPVVIDRQDFFRGFNRQTHREWVYRQAFHMGRHVIGYELEKVMAAVDWFRQEAPALPVGVAGYGEGGLVALYAAALDTRIDAALVSGYFGPRDEPWREPIDRNLFGVVNRFGVAEIAALIAPRTLLVEHSPVPEVHTQKGDVTQPAFNAVRNQFDRIATIAGDRLQQRELYHSASGGTLGPGSREALAGFLAALRIAQAPDMAVTFLPDQRREFSADDRMLRQVWELDNYTQWLVRNSDHVRYNFFLHTVLPEIPQQRWSTVKEHRQYSPARLLAAQHDYRRDMKEDILGSFDDTPLPFNPRIRKIYDRPTWTGYEVVLDVFPDLIAWGYLLVPKDLQAGEQRPVVVCQHGRHGLPEQLAEGNSTAYNNMAAQLAERGFITFAPHNLYRHEDRYRWLDRKANNVGKTLFSFINAQHQQITDWLQILPFVDGDRIAFYGLSYGGESAMRIPAVVTDYCLSICSGDFNDWTRKVSSTRNTHSFMNTREWEMPYFNMGPTFSYAEMAYLIFPRPFMVERGHHDKVAPDEWVAYEYAKVRRLYAEMGMSDRTEIEFFLGGHSMRGEGTIRFLHKHLDWPEPE